MNLLHGKSTLEEVLAEPKVFIEYNDDIVRFDKKTKWIIAVNIIKN